MSALVWGCPKPVRWPTVDAAGVGAHGRRALSCPPRPTVKAARLSAWAALGGSGRLGASSPRGGAGSATASARRPWPHCWWSTHCLGLAQVARASRRQCWASRPFDPRSKSARRWPRPFSRRPVAVAAHDALARPVPWQGSSSRGGRRRARRGSSESVAESCCHGRGELLPRRATERGCHATARPLAPSSWAEAALGRVTLFAKPYSVRRCVA